MDVNVQAVALGAAVQAGILEGRVSNVMVMDIWQASLMRAYAKQRLKEDKELARAQGLSDDAFSDDDFSDDDFSDDEVKPHPRLGITFWTCTNFISLGALAVIVILAACQNYLISLSALTDHETRPVLEAFIVCLLLHQSAYIAMWTGCQCCMPLPLVLDQADHVGVSRQALVSTAFVVQADHGLATSNL